MSEIKCQDHVFYYDNCSEQIFMNKNDFMKLVELTNKYLDKNELLLEEIEKLKEKVKKVDPPEKLLLFHCGPCDKTFKTSSLTAHNKSDKHQLNIKKNVAPNEEIDFNEFCDSFFAKLPHKY